MIRRSFLMVLGSAVALSACGFQLRGQQNYAFKHLLIVGGPPSVQARLTRLVEAGSVKPMVERTMPLADAAIAHRMVEDNAVTGRIVLTP